MLTAVHSVAVKIGKDQLVTRRSAQCGDEFVRFHLLFVLVGFLRLILQQTLLRLRRSPFMRSSFAIHSRNPVTTWLISRSPCFAQRSATNFTSRRAYTKQARSR